MKKYILLISLLLCSLSIYASPDFSIRAGHGVFLNDTNYEPGLHGLAGVNVGLTQKLELNIETILTLVPDPFTPPIAGVELTYNLKDRVRNNNVAGSSLNYGASIGLFCGPYDNGKYGPSYFTLRFFPISLGNPAIGIRQTLLPIGVAYNFRSNQFSLFFSFAVTDFYLNKTWRTNLK